MAVTQQRLHKIEFMSIKNLNSFTLDLEPHNVTGIFGINGSGKSTIIYSALCLFKPTDANHNRKDFKFSQFFTHTTHSRFIGSSFKITHSAKQDASPVNPQVERQYSKTDRWKPRYTERPQRNVYFVGINTCVPEIEVEKSENFITLTTNSLTDTQSVVIRQKAEIILNRQYSQYNIHNDKSGRKKYIGVNHNGIPYSALSMGAGEQRVFKILDTIFRAEQYSLIVIDEIDLTLHTDALCRLIDVLVEQAKAKDIQIIFTSHREELTQRTDINIRHIHQAGTQTLCFNETNPDCITRLTGNQIRPLEIFVEDDLAEVTAQKVIEELNIRRFCIIRRFGSINNSFSLATGMLLKGEDLANIIIILDGDKFTTAPERLTQMQKFFAGSETDAHQKRISALSCVKQFTLPNGTPPEQFINDSIRALGDNSEITIAASSINAVANKHDFVNKIISILGYQEPVQGLTKVIDKLVTTPGWAAYTQELRDWLTSRVQALRLS